MGSRVPVKLESDTGRLLGAMPVQDACHERRQCYGFHGYLARWRRRQEAAGVYTLRYRAAQDGEKLVIRWTFLKPNLPYENGIGILAAAVIE